jgi:FKBP-type peptidyl-prolyl cis-trans isomerase FkpA
VQSNILIIITCISFFSCHHKTEENKMGDEEIKQRMANVNRILVHNESKEIEEFISRHQWKMQSSGTGLRYMLYEKANGNNPMVKVSADIAYKVFLLDGTLCYGADEKHPLKIIFGKGQQSAGLEEGLQQMGEGDRARLVVPSHLAYGMTGDGNKIPAGSPLYYDVKLLAINRK